MSIPTTPAFIHVGTWDDETRKHPAMKWMEDFTLEFNKRVDWDKDGCDWCSRDFTIIKPDGASFTGNVPAFAEAKNMYEFFTSEFHEPYFLVAWEINDGWGMLGQANFYANLKGNATSQEKKVQDLSGRDWDVKIPSAFHFVYEKQNDARHDGIVLKKIEIMSDSFPAVQLLMARGVIQQ